MGRLGMDDGEPIEHRMVSNAIAKAQMRVESHNFDIRKHLLEYDDVMNQQREVIYSQRRQILGGENLKEDFLDMAGELVDDLVAEYVPDNTVEEMDVTAFEISFRRQFGLCPPWTGRATATGPNTWLTRCGSATRPSPRRWARKCSRTFSRWSCSRSSTTTGKTTCSPWTTYGTASVCGDTPSKTPCGSIRRRATSPSWTWWHRIKADTVGTVFYLQVRPYQEVPEEARPAQQQMVLSHGDSGGSSQPVQRKNGKVGRNDPCPCGSGKKYKKCCGK